MCSMCTAKRMIPRGSHSIQFESFLIVSTKTGKKSLKINVKHHSTPAWNDIWAMWEQFVCLLLACRQETLLGISNEWTISRLPNRFQQTGNVADWPRSGKPHKTTPREDHFRMTSSQRKRFLSSPKLGHLLRNATDTKVCDRTVRNRQHAARLKGCHPYVGILLTWRNYRACCNNITLGFSDMIMPVHTLRGIPRTFYTSITSLCCSGLQDHRISLPLSTYGTT